MALLIMFLPNLPAQAQRQVAECPRSSPTSKHDKQLDYKKRGDRCEGLYAIPVSPPSRPRIIGFHNRDLPQRPFSETNSAVVALDRGRMLGSVSLRLTSLRPRLFYAMDTELPAGASRYSWSTEILSSSSVNLNTSEIGILACSNLCRPQPATVYFPASLATSNGASETFSTIIQSEVNLYKTNYRLTDEAGKVIREQQLRSRITGSRPFVVRLGKLASGTYRLRLNAETFDGARTFAIFSLKVP